MNQKQRYAKNDIVLKSLSLSLQEYQHKRAELERNVRTLQSEITEAEKETKRLQRDIQVTRFNKFNEFIEKYSY